MEVSLLVFQCCDTYHNPHNSGRVIFSGEAGAISGSWNHLTYLIKKTPHLFSDEEHFLEMEVDFLQPLLDIEARTALANPGEVAMA